MPGHDVIVMGASTGGVEALIEVVGGLPPDLDAAVCIVLHMPPNGSNLLPKILSRHSALPCASARDGEPLVPGQVYVAVPDYHLLIEDGLLRLVRGPKENRSRPAIDPLFRSAAVAYGPRVIGVVLTGALDDGTSGLFAVKSRGGLAIVQDPEDALMPAMPRSAMEFVDVDYVLPLVEIAPKLAELTRVRVEKQGGVPVPEDLKFEVRISESAPSALYSEERPGKLSGWTCPECKGPLWEVHDGELVRFRCRVGHAYTADAMLVGKSEELEQALWTALNALKESAGMASRLAEEARARGHVRVAQRFDEKAASTVERAALIRRALLNGEAAGPDEDANLAAVEAGPTEQRSVG